MSGARAASGHESLSAPIRKILTGVALFGAVCLVATNVFVTITARAMNLDLMIVARGENPRLAVA